MLTLPKAKLVWAKIFTWANFYTFELNPPSAPVYFWLDQGNHPVVDGDNNNRDSENKNNAKLVCAKQFQAADERK